MTSIENMSDMKILKFFICMSVSFFGFPSIFEFFNDFNEKEFMARFAKKRSELSPDNTFT